MQICIDEYNQLLEIYEERGYKFTRKPTCPKIKINIFKQEAFLCDYDEGTLAQHSHRMVNIHTLARTSYMACITLPDGKHIHDIFPIMIGSKLDIQMHEPYVYNANEKLNGLYIIEGLAVIFPFIYTNHRESIHQDFKTGEMILYLYDDEKQGYKIYEKGSNNYVIRFPTKVEHNLETFDEKINFPLNDYVDFKRQHEAFGIFKTIQPTLKSIRDNIDSFKNKILLHPLSMIERAIQMAIKCHIVGQKKNPARDILLEGNIERLVSKNIQFCETRTRGGNFKKSYGYRKVTPSNVGRPNLNLQILRPAPKNVQTTSTVDSYGFICLAEKNTSLDAHTKTLCGIENSKVLSFVDVTRNDIRQVLDTLYAAGCLVDNSTLTGLPLLLNGGLRSKYNIVWDREKSFNYIKKHINQFIEVVYINELYCMLSIVEGLTFINIDGCFYTTKEMDIYCPEKVKEVNLFGPNVYPHVIDDGGYLVVSRLMTGVNYSKNRFGGSDNLSCFTTTNENSCVYITDDRFDKKTETLSADVVFSSHPQLCADGIIVDRDRPIKATIITRSRFELEIPTLFNFQPLNYNEPMIEYDECGNVVMKIFPIAKFQKRGEPLNINIFKQNNFFYTKQEHVDATTYILYKTVNEKETLDHDKIFLDIYSTKNKLFIDFYTKATNRVYDGLKLSDQCAQKGLTMLQDVSEYENVLGYKPQIVMSLSSIIGRTPIHQCKMVLRNKKTKDKILGGNYNFDVLKNTAFTMLSKGKIRLDSQMKSVLGINGLSKTLTEFEKSALEPKHRDMFLPPDSEIPLGIINVLKTCVEYSDESGNTYTSLNVNKEDLIKCKRRRLGSVTSASTILP